jgi:hypothetical protein
MLRRALSLSFPALALAVACGGTTGTPDAGGPSAEEAAGALATAVCTKTAECVGPTLFTIAWESPAVCTERRKRQYASGLVAPGTGATPAKTKECADAVTATTCADFLAEKLPPACAPVPGTRPVGAACVAGSQCATSFCSIPKDSTCGFCAAAPKAGEACVNGDCPLGLRCAAGACQPIAQAGASCDAARPCAFGLSCVGGTCAANGGPGDSCDAAAVSAPRCDLTRALYCDFTAKKCVAAGAASSGDACGVQGMRYFLCEAPRSFCKLSTAASGTCAPYAADGAACSDDPQVGAPCAEPARCVKGVCVFPDPAACP